MYSEKPFGIILVLFYCKINYFSVFYIVDFVRFLSHREVYKILWLGVYVLINGIFKKLLARSDF